MFLNGRASFLQFQISVLHFLRHFASLKEGAAIFVEGERLQTLIPHFSKVGALGGTHSRYRPITDQWVGLTKTDDQKKTISRHLNAKLS